MVDLHSRIASELSRRLEVAREQPPYPWRLNAEGDEVWADDDELVADAHALSGNQVRAVARFIALHDPADQERRYSSALRVLERHRRYIVPEGYGALSGKPNCAVCNGHVYPCDEVVDLCASLGLDTEGSTTDGNG